MILLNPKTEILDHLDPHTRDLLKKTIQWFEFPGKTKTQR